MLLFSTKLANLYDDKKIYNLISYSILKSITSNGTK